MLPTELAEIIVETLNNKSDFEFSQDFTAHWSYIPNWELKELKDLRVTVVVPALASARHDKTRRIADVTVHIGIQKKLKADPNADPVIASDNLVNAANPYAALLYEFSDLFFQNPQQGEAFWKSEELTLYDYDKLKEDSMYFAVLSLTYQMLRD